MAGEDDFDLGEDDFNEIDEEESQDRGENEALDGDEEAETEGQGGQRGNPDQDRQEQGRGGRTELGRKTNRAQERIQALDRQNKELKDRLDALERQRNTPAPSQAEIFEQQRIEQERLALMSPEERADYRINQTEQRLQAQLRRMEVQNADQTNRAAFQAKATVDPVYKRYAQDVEDRLAQVHRQNPGQFVDRELILKIVIGERALANAGRANARGQKKGEASKARQTAQGGAARSDLQGDRAGNRANNGLRDRLRNQFI